MLTPKGLDEKPLVMRSSALMFTELGSGTKMASRCDKRYAGRNGHCQ